MKNDLDKVLLCKDCKHSFVPYADRLFFIFTKFVTEDAFMCKKSRELYKEWNPVTGFKVTKGQFYQCSTYRSKDFACGRQGKYWTPKHKKDFFKLLTKD